MVEIHIVLNVINILLYDIFMQNLDLNSVENDCAFYGSQKYAALVATVRIVQYVIGH